MLNKLDADDDWRSISWTDIKGAGGHNDIEKAGLSELSEQGGSGPGSYLYVKPGQTPGNVLIEIKSGRIKGNPTLWSWHIWIVDNYPTVLDVAESGEVMVENGSIDVASVGSVRKGPITV